MAYEFIILEKEAGIATLTLNRPDRLNALTDPMRDEMVSAIEDVSKDDGVRVLVLTGAGRGFCAGADAPSLGEHTAPSAIEVRKEDPFAHRGTGRVIALLRELSKPTITALNGAVAGAGIGLVLATDIIIASENARMRVAFVARGLVPGDGVTYLLPRAIGVAKALEIMYTNDPVDGREMERLGLVNRVVPSEKLMEETRALAARVAKGPPIAMAAAKKAVRKGMEQSIEAQMDLESRLFNVCSQTEDHQEGIKSMLEKRDPVFKGR